MGRGQIATAAATLAGLLVSAAAPALETDQYYAWDRELRDSSDAINAKMNLEIREELGRINRRSGGALQPCEEVTRRISRRFRFFIFHDIELWAVNSSLVDRIPASPEEELRYRRDYLYAGRPVDPVRWMPPSPTIEVAGVRLGTDKLSHFVSEGWYYYRWYRGGRRRGQSPEEAKARALRRGLLVERTVLGGASSGVLSLADLEANYEGMEFLIGLCEGDRPALRATGEGWTLERPFDLADHVTPEWDESWQPSVFSRRRWRAVLPVLRRYCGLLESPAVVERHAAYVLRDRLTPTERHVARLVDEGRIEDPRQFSLQRACETAGTGADP